MIDTTAMELMQVAKAMVAPGKGILAADESGGTIAKRFAAIGVESTEVNRRDYREALFRTPGLGRFIAGVILYDETLRQRAADGTPLVDLLLAGGMIPGIKVDAGAKPLPGAPGETITEGLDGLAARFAEARSLGARFSKWRAVLRIGGGRPTPQALTANAEALARYAALSQAAGIVPIVEPEVLMDGDHGIEACEAATTAALREVFTALARHGVLLEGMILKPNMVLPGEDHAPSTPEEVAEATIRTFLRAVPAAVPGIAFLSGGQSDDDATANLAAIARHGRAVGAPWSLTFSYGRGLQAAPQAAWRGVATNVPLAQAALLERASAVAAARAA